MPTPHQKEISLEDAQTLAVNHLNAGNYRVAELTLRDILKAVPNDYRSMYLLGMALYHLGNRQECLTWLGKAANSNKATAEWLSDYGAILNGAGRNDEAIQAFDKALKIEPKNAAVLWNKCYALWLAERYKEAEKAGEKAVKIAPDSPEAWLNLGAAKVRLDKREEGVECWEKALALRPDFAFAWNNLGNVLRELGRLEEAEEKCLKALELDPTYPEAMNNLANIHLDRGRHAEAEQWYRRAIASRPDYAEAHNNLCAALMQQSRYDEAVMHGRYAVSFKPNYAEAHMHLGEALRNLGHVDEARRAIEQAVILRPNSAEVHMDVADILMMQDRFAEAEVELKRAEELKPDNPRTFVKLAAAQERAGKVDEALASLDRAIEMNPENPDAFIRKGRISLIANRPEEAKKLYEKAQKLAPNHPAVFLSLADLHLTLGDLKKTETFVNKAKKVTPANPGLFYTMSHVKKFTRDDPDFALMRKLEKTIDSHGLEQASILNYALFEAWEDVADYKKAFAALKKANDLKRKLLPFDHERQRAFFERQRETFTPEYLESLRGKGYKSTLPVFIVGMPRSGTTLTEQIISSHPDVYGAGELAELTQLEQEIGPLSAKTCRDLGALYVKKVRKLDKSRKAKRITDKMPGNYAHIGMIASILPHAKIIHCRRDPIDTCLSCYKQNFARGQYWSYNLKELGEHYRDYEAMMSYWREVLPGRFLEIDYEETVNDFENQARKLIDFVDLPWHKACLAPHKQKRAVLTASKTQVIQPVYKTSVKAWKRYEKQLKPLIDALDIKPVKRAPGKKSATAQKLSTAKKSSKTGKR